MYVCNTNTTIHMAGGDVTSTTGLSGGIFTCFFLFPILFLLLLLLYGYFRKSGACLAFTCRENKLASSAPRLCSHSYILTSFLPRRHGDATASKLRAVDYYYLWMPVKCICQKRRSAQQSPGAFCSAPPKTFLEHCGVVWHMFLK